MISVIMSTYKEPVEYIHYSVQSILNQTYTDFEFIIVVDDPENAPVIAALEEYAAKDSRVKLHINTKNLGPAGARNAALSHATGEYIAVLDADDCAMPQRLEKQLQFMQETDADLVSCRQQQFSDDAILGVPPYLTGKQLHRYIRIANPLVHSGWLAKKAVYDTLGGYRNIPKAEDFDFLLRAFAANYRILQQDQVLIHYRLNPNGDSQTALLQQFLTAHYLSRHSRNIQNITPEQVQQYVLPRLTEQALAHYAEAQNAIAALHSHKHASFGRRLLWQLRASFTSRYFFLQRLRSLRMKLIRLLYK